MEWVEVFPPPQECRECGERRACIARGEGEWCCDACDYLRNRFIPASDETGPPKNRA